MIDELVIYNDKSIQILDGILWRTKPTAVEVMVREGVACFEYFDDNDPDNPGAFLVVKVPPGTPLDKRLAVWKSTTFHLGR